MTIDRRTFLTAAAGAAGAAALPQVARAQFTRGYQQPLTIGVNVPLTGDGAAAGGQIVAGVQAAIDEANRLGGALSSAFQIRTFDDMDALAQSMLNVQFAASDATILAMIGGYDGALIAGALQSYANEQMPLLVPGSTADAVTARGYRNVWRLPAKDSTEGQLAAEYIGRRIKPKLAVAVTQDGDYGADIAQGFLNEARAAKFTAMDYLFPQAHADYQAAAKAIVSKSPDYVYLCGTTSAMGPLVTALRSAGYQGAFGASQGFYNEQTLKTYAKEMEGAVISTPQPPLERAPDVANALADFRAQSPVTSLSSFAYASAQIVIAAVRRTGASNRLSTLTALQAPTPYNTLVGPFQFAFNGDPIDPLVYFYTVTGGKFRFTAPSHVTPFVL